MQAAQALSDAPTDLSAVHAAACRQERPSQASLPDSGSRGQPAWTALHAQPAPGTKPYARLVAEHRPGRFHAAWQDQKPGSASSGNELKLAPELLADLAAEAAGEADLEVMHHATEQETEAEMQYIYESALEDCFGGSQAPYTAAGMLHATIHVAAQAHPDLQQQGTRPPGRTTAVHAAGEARQRLQQQGHVTPTASQPQWPQPGLCTVAEAAGNRQAWQAEPEAKSPSLLDLQSDRDFSFGEQASTGHQARDWLGQACQKAQQDNSQPQWPAGRRHTPAATLQETVPDSPTVTLSPVLASSLAPHEHLSASQGCHHHLQHQHQPALVSATPSPAGLAEPPPPLAEWLNVEQDSRNGGSLSVTPEHIAFQLGQQPDTAPAQVRTAWDDACHHVAVCHGLHICTKLSMLWLVRPASSSLLGLASLYISQLFLHDFPAVPVSTLSETCVSLLIQQQQPQAYRPLRCSVQAPLPVTTSAPWRPPPCPLHPGLLPMSACTGCSSTSLLCFCVQALIAACCSHPVAATLSQLLRNGHLPLPACTVLGVSPVDLTLAGLLALLQRARLDVALLDSMTLLAAVWTLGEHATLNSALNSASGRWVSMQP